MEFLLLAFAMATQPAATPANPMASVPRPSEADIRRCGPRGVTSQTPMTAIPRAQRAAAAACLQALVARQLNLGAPIAIDEATTFVSASSTGGMLQYNYRVDLDADQVTVAEREGLAASTRAAMCATPRIQQLLALGGSYRYVWVDRQDRPLHQLLIQRCP